MGRISGPFGRGEGKGRWINVGIESKDGTLLTEKGEMMCRCREHFSELLGSEQEEEGVIGEDLSRGEFEDRSEWSAQITRGGIRCRQIEEGKS